ncbi:hypothetical protein LTR05_000035 [Lithohypha guttulata]|uniref:Terpene cyclase/mutase family member n=1 Tax=Lithohypha guttulata TaxID=1690604 RepID=A0AAN7YIZ5_9EURO|nr:hypothetical protein LTR05_000035 [Lithohypha guttulata]
MSLNYEGRSLNAIRNQNTSTIQMLLVKNSSIHEDLRQLTSRAAGSAEVYAFQQVHADGHWCGKLFCDVSITCEYVFLMFWLKLDISKDQGAFVHHIQRAQRADGSWGLVPDAPGHASPSTEAYLALKLLGVDPELPLMRRARAFILSQGGMASIRNITRIWLALFGILPWSALPQMPAELILFPSNTPFSVYKFASWARALIVPLLILDHHKPAFDLPDTETSSDRYLDELWLDPLKKDIAYGKSYTSLASDREWTALAMKLSDKFLYHLTSTGLFPSSWTRKMALRKCLEWIFAHIEPSGHYPPGNPPGFIAVVAMHVANIGMNDPRFVRALQALDTFVIREKGEAWVQTTDSPVWDTILMSTALLDLESGLGERVEVRKAHIRDALQWVKDRQIKYGSSGDWRTYRPLINPGCWSIQYFDTWNPDLDDTAAAVIVLLKHDPSLVESDIIVSAVEWILGMQNSDAGWGTFEAENTNFYLEKLPFCDTSGLLCDASMPDVTGRALEALGGAKKEGAMELHDRLKRVHQACDRAIQYLITHQEVNGAWYGRWAVNYIFGTSTVLCGLQYFTGLTEFHHLNENVERGLRFLSSWQNTDGGWGESSRSYSWKPCEYIEGKDNDIPTCGSTPSQTAWALMGLLAYLPAGNSSVQRGIKHLIDTQTTTGQDLTDQGTRVNGTTAEVQGKTWPEEVIHTGTSLPGWMMLRYEYYKHYFPMMALGRYLAKVEEAEALVQ